VFPVVRIHALEVGRNFLPRRQGVNHQALGVDVAVDYQSLVNNFLERLTQASRKEESSLVVEFAWIFSQEFEHLL